MSTVVQREQYTIADLRYRFSVGDFARMVDSGILGEGDRVELIDGEVRQKSPIGSLHASIVNRLNRILVFKLGERAIVSVQNPVILSDFTEPQPDLLVLKPHSDEYARALPRPEDVLLLIEVADSTLEYDREDKLPRYAEVQIPEVWLVDVNGREITRYNEPEGRSYTQSHVFVAGKELVSIAIDSLRISVDDIFLIGR